MPHSSNPTPQNSLVMGTSHPTPNVLQRLRRFAVDVSGPGCHCCRVHGYRRSQDFVWGCTSFAKKVDNLF